MAKRANVRTVEEKKSARSLQRDATLLRRSPQFRWILPSKIGRQLPVAALGQGNARTRLMAAPLPHLTSAVVHGSLAVAEFTSVGPHSSMVA